ncbi:MAG TPA: hypothetical protein VFH47_06385 [Candidatus Thermoplasmatota archaeon]|nr:hypothetical protein [Candidatus Thermoplasmatota archaeon]
MNRVVLLLGMLAAATLAGCVNGSDGGPEPPMPPLRPDDGDIPRVPVSNASVGPPPGGPAVVYQPPNRTAAPDDQPPVVEILAALDPGNTRLVANFTLNGTDPEGGQIEWRFDGNGDGRFETSGRGLPAQVQVVFTREGTYVATLQAHDGFHEVATDLAIEVTTRDLTPFYDATGSYTVGLSCQLNVFTFTFTNIPALAAYHWWHAHWNVSGPHSQVRITFLDADGNVLQTVSSGTDLTLSLHGTVPVGTTSARVTSCGGTDPTVRLVIEPSAYCRPVTYNCSYAYSRPTRD